MFSKKQAKSTMRNQPEKALPEKGDWKQIYAGERGQVRTKEGKQGDLLHYGKGQKAALRPQGNHHMRGGGGCTEGKWATHGTMAKKEKRKPERKGTKNKCVSSPYWGGRFFSSKKERGKENQGQGHAGGGAVEHPGKWDLGREVCPNGKARVAWQEGEEGVRKGRTEEYPTCPKASGRNSGGQGRESRESARPGLPQLN